MDAITPSHSSSNSLFTMAIFRCFALMVTCMLCIPFSLGMMSSEISITCGGYIVILGLISASLPVLVWITGMTWLHWMSICRWWCSSSKLAQPASFWFWTREAQKQCPGRWWCLVRRRVSTPTSPWFYFWLSIDSDPYFQVTSDCL